MEALQRIDAALFKFINSDLSNPVTDKLMPFITERDNWFIFYVLIWLYLFFYGGRKGKIASVLILILILISDQFSDNILKPLVNRIRPCHTLPDVRLLVGCTDSFSFPSIHAVNNFAAATLFSYFYRDMKYFLFTGAFVVGISRVFCGVHYPFDVLGGAIAGVIFALIIIYFWKFINRRLKIV
ncbi:MAG: phosphatase PAP2 family protein [Ignavibacteria bacterium]|nr:phosphatase PAP2 family protein [Ignavibacteria bacterium]